MTFTLYGNVKDILVAREIIDRGLTLTQTEREMESTSDHQTLSRALVFKLTQEMCGGNDIRTVDEKSKKK